MPISPDLVYDELQQILSDQHTNIFDVFATVYPYCDENYGDIHIVRSDIVAEKEIKQKALQIQKTLLPDSKQSKDPLDETKRKEILTEFSNKTDYGIKCFTLMYAIDRLYDNLYAGFALSSNISNPKYNLNTNLNKGRVLTKLESSIINAINTIVEGWEVSTNKHYIGVRWI
jgi:hypothetical protein